MKFLKNLGICLILMLIFFFFGGGLLFEMSEGYYLSAAAWAFVLAVLLTIIESMAEKLESLEERVKALEKSREDKTVN